MATERKHYSLAKGAKEVFGQSTRSSITGNVPGTNAVSRVADLFVVSGRVVDAARVATFYYASAESVRASGVNC